MTAKVRKNILKRATKNRFRVSGPAVREYQTLARSLLEQSLRAERDAVGSILQFWTPLEVVYCEYQERKMFAYLFSDKSGACFWSLVEVKGEMGRWLGYTALSEVVK